MRPCKSVPASARSWFPALISIAAKTVASRSTIPSPAKKSTPLSPSPNDGRVGGSRRRRGAVSQQRMPLVEYSRLPSGSLSSLEVLPNGGVRITIPPMLRRRIGTIALVITSIGVSLSLLVLLAPLPKILDTVRLLAVSIFLPSIACLVVTLWMGFRRTIIEADESGLRLELRGLLLTRRKFWPREQITSLRKRISLQIVGVGGAVIGKIDATDPTEERWLLEVLRTSLGIKREDK